jgi:hypothetical protein
MVFDSPDLRKPQRPLGYLVSWPMLKPGAPQIQIKSFTKVIYSALMALFSTKRNTGDSDVRFSGVYTEIKE